MGVRIAELPSSKDISKTDLIIVQDNEATKQGTIQQLDVSIDKQAEEEYQASQVQSTKDELANQKFLTEYVACMAGIELPVDEEETEGMTHVQDFE